MRSHNAPRERRHARAENYPPPARFFHGGDTELHQQVRRAAIGPPGLLEDLNRDLSDVLHAVLAGRQACIVEQDGRGAHFSNDILMQFSDAVIVAEVRLEMFGFDVVFGA